MNKSRFFVRKVKKMMRIWTASGSEKNRRKKRKSIKKVVVRKNDRICKTEIL